MTAHISVVIPYFQRQPGILSKAVASALAQTDIGSIHIIIVDDASPVPAREELAERMLARPGAITIIEQSNAGPAAARNKGLDHVSPDTEYVAFLDSDDTWIPTHLANALAALDAGNDFYFSDLFQLNQTVSAFKRAGRITPTQHPQIGDSGHLHSFAGDMFDQILMGNVIGTSTVVYRYRLFPALRFREQFVYAGEDYLFWLELSLLTRRIAFSSLSESIYGPGVNVFAGSGWGTEKSLIRCHYEMKYKKAIRRIFTLSTTQSAANKLSVSALRNTFVADVLHRLAHRKPIGTDVLLSQLKVDPQTFLYFVPICMAQIVRRRRAAPGQ